MRILSVTIAVLFAGMSIYQEYIVHDLLSATNCIVWAVFAMSGVLVWSDK